MDPAFKLDSAINLNYVIFGSLQCGFYIDKSEPTFRSYFPAFGLNPEIYGLMDLFPNAEKYGHISRGVKVLAMRLNPLPEAYLVHSRTSTMELFCELL